jgi:cellobiose-specific phosphotransferase system component IIB
MHITVVLAVGLDSWQLTSQGSELRSAGFVVISANSIRDAIEQFKVGDFDLVLLGPYVSAEHKERLTSLIRTAGSRTPVVCIPNSSGDCNSFEDGTLQDDSRALLTGMEEILANTPRAQTVPVILCDDAADGAAHR